MKKILFFLVVSAILAAAACTPEDNPDGPVDDGEGTEPQDTTATVIAVERLVLDTVELSLYEGESYTLSVSVFPEEAQDYSLEWTTSDVDVATVAQDGTVTAVSAGEAVVTVSTGDVSAECAVTVMEEKSFPIETVLVPAGSFIMGTPVSEPNRGDDETQHEVTISEDFYMGKYEITNAQFAEFLNAIGCPESGTYDIEGEGNQMLVRADEWGCMYEGGKWVFDPEFENKPAICVTWFGANEYAKWIGGQLPTEAQWEYACRGGQTESLPFGIGDGHSLTYDLANFRSNFPYDDAAGGQYEDASADYRGITTDVGSFEPNGFGLYDMHGNVYEWCSDWKADYPEGPVTDPHGPDTPTPEHTKVIRGGGWFIHGQYCRSGDRDHFMPFAFDIYIGFRVVFPK